MKANYCATNRQVAKICKILDVGMAKVMPQFMIWPKFIACFVIYFITDLGSEAFELPLPAW